jgi:hypothetical protein
MKSNHVELFWEQICEQQVKDIYDHYYQWYQQGKDLDSTIPVDQIDLMIEFLIEESDNLTKPITDQMIKKMDDNPIFFDIASYAILGIDSIGQFYGIDWFYITNILIKKQKDYGPENIMKFGVTGIIVRLYDKVARLKNLLSKVDGDISKAIHANSVNGESVLDTLIDIIGYSTIALMIMEKDDIYRNKFLVPMNPEPAVINITEV